MTIEQFGRAVKVANLLEAGRKWFPKWISGYALFHKIAPSDSVTLDENRVIGYLRHLRDKGTQAWQRKQAAIALQTYQNILVR